MAQARSTGSSGEPAGVNPARMAEIKVAPGVMTPADVLPDELTPGVAYVTPTRRLAHHLRARHDAACLARGLRVWRTPDVVTWPELLQRQFEADRAAGRTVLRWLSPSHAGLAWEQIVRRDPGQQHLLARAGLGAAAYRSWQLLHAYGIPYAALSADEGMEIESFARWVAQYRAWLDAGRWLDPSLAATVVGPPAPGTHFCFVGFDRWTPQQAAFLDRLRETGVRLELPEPLADDVAIVAEVVECDDFDAELDVAARWAAQRLHDRPGDRLALIVPGLARERGRVRRALDRVLAPATALTGGPAPASRAYDIASALPLLERAVVAAALAWLEASAAPTRLAQASALLLGPYDRAAAAEAHARAELDVALRQARLPRRGLEGVAADARARGCVVTAVCFERAAARARRWHGTRRPSEWVPAFAGLLADVGWPGGDADSAEHQSVQRWRQLLGEFGAGDDVAGPLSATAAIRQLRELAARTPFEPQEVAAPLLVIDPDTAQGMRFDALWIAGVDAARWPAPAGPDPFLPREWQACQGVPASTAELAARAARRTLARLSQAASAVFCSVPRFEDEAPLLPSALVAELPRANGLALWREPEPARALFDARPMLDTIVDGALPACAAHEVVKGGARLLELQAACPFRAAVELRLGGRELEDPVVGIAPTERGRLAHLALQRFWSEVREQAALLALSPAALADRVAAVASEVLRPLRQDADEVRHRLLDFEQRWLEARVLELLALDAQREPFTVLHVEESHVVDVGGVQVCVVLDRVDRLGDGSYALVDYKTGRDARPAAWLGERPEQPQLPLYVRTVAPEEVGAVAFATLRKGHTGYAGWARRDGVFSALTTFDVASKPFREYADWKALLEQWERRLDALGREHAQGDASLAPDPTQACRHCHLSGLCRSAEAVIAIEEGADAAG